MKVIKYIFFIVGALVSLYFVYGISSLLYHALIVPSAINTADKLGSCYLKRPFFGSEVIYYYNSQEELQTLKRTKADAKTFKVLPSNDCLGKDEKRVYYKDIPVPDADPATFEPVPGQGKYVIYYWDRDTVFFGGEPLDNADRETFRVTPSTGTGYAPSARDKNREYYYDPSKGIKDLPIY